MMTARWCALVLLATAHADDAFFATDATTAIRRLRAALPYDARVCATAAAPDARVACAERAFLDRAAHWLAWHTAFRADTDCARFCGTAAEVTFAFQGHRRLRKGYGNHIFATLRALVVAIQQNRSVVLGLDQATRDLNTPHLHYADESVWTLGALRRRYVLCRCARKKGKRFQVNLKGLGPDEHLPLAASDPRLGAGLIDVLGWTAAGSQSTRVGGDATSCGKHVGHSFLRPAFDELLGAPNAFGARAASPTPSTLRSTASVRRPSILRVLPAVGAHPDLRLESPHVSCLRLGPARPRERPPGRRDGERAARRPRGVGDRTREA